jgi:hypothetical protein
LAGGEKAGETDRTRIHVEEWDMAGSGVEPLAVDTPIITSLVVAIATHAKAAKVVEDEGVLVTGRDGSPVRNRRRS